MSEEDKKSKIIREFIGSTNSTTRVPYPVTKYECICHCGKIYFPTKCNFDKNRSNSCGCARYKNIRPRSDKQKKAIEEWINFIKEKTLKKTLNYKTKRFKVVSLHCSEYRSLEKSYFKCLCSCGQFFIALGSHLKSRRSCGCAIKKKKKGEGSARGMLTNHKAITIRNLSYCYTIKQLSEMFSISPSTIYRIINNQVYVDQ